MLRIVGWADHGCVRCYPGPTWIHHYERYSLTRQPVPIHRVSALVGARIGGVVFDGQ